MKGSFSRDRLLLEKKVLKYRHLTKVNDEKGHSQVKKELLKLAKLA